MPLIQFITSTSAIMCVCWWYNVLFLCKKYAFNVIDRYDICQVLFTTACVCSVRARQSSSFARRRVPPSHLCRRGRRERCRSHVPRLLRRRRRRLRRRQAAAAHAPRMRSAAGAPDVRRDAGVCASAGRRRREFSGGGAARTIKRRSLRHLRQRIVLFAAHRTAVLGDQSLVQAFVTFPCLGGLLEVSRVAFDRMSSTVGHFTFWINTFAQRKH